jgi:hypothetical protein
MAGFPFTALHVVNRRLADAALGRAKVDLITMWFWSLKGMLQPATLHCAAANVLMYCITFGSCRQAWAADSEARSCTSTECTNNTTTCCSSIVQRHRLVGNKYII